MKGFLPPLLSQLKSTCIPFSAPKNYCIRHMQLFKTCYKEILNRHLQKSLHLRLLGA